MSSFESNLSDCALNDVRDASCAERAPAPAQTWAVSAAGGRAAAAAGAYRLAPAARLKLRALAIMAGRFGPTKDASKRLGFNPSY